MSSRTPDHQRLDGRALEARTQAIGRELFAAAKRTHAHLSTLNRWADQVLSWCLADPAVKHAVLRFIDVLPSLASSRDIARHIRDYFPTDELRLPAALRLGAGLAQPGPLTQGALAAVVRRLVEQVARQFIAEFGTDGVDRVVRDLAARGCTCSLDVLGEQVLSESEADRYVAQCDRLVRDLAAVYAELPPTTSLRSCGSRANLSVKPSALSPRFDPISPPQSLERASRRLAPLLERAARHGVTVNLDMEQYELRDLTVALAQHLLTLSGDTARAPLGIVVQAYLRDAEAMVETLLAWLATHQQRLTVRLVKGAYWDVEVAWAQRRRWLVPVQEDKALTDLAFERLTRRLLGAAPLVTTAIASHNVRSIAHAMACAESLGLAPDQMEFQFLYGMGEPLQAAVVERGYPVRVYTPVGELIPGMAYLVRRLLENTANESFLRQEFLRERSPDALLAVPVPGAPGGLRVLSPHDTPEWREEPLTDFSRTEPRERLARALAGVRAQLGGEYPLLLGDGAARTATQLTIRNPARPDEVLGHVASAAAADVERAMRLASAAQPAWARRSVHERAACLRRAAQTLREQRDELTAWMILEVGKPWREADAELVEAIEYLEYYSQRMVELERGRPLLQSPGERNHYRYEPRGVAAVIAPWNFPAAILTGMTSAALVSGNAVLLKPAEQSPIIAARFVGILRSAGIPPGALQYLPGIGEEVGAALVRHPDTQTLLFTGSKAVGLSIIEAAARVVPGQRFVKHVVAEMGGKNAIIVDADADLDAAVAGSLQSAFGYAGQKCSAASRLIVHRTVYDRFVARLIDATSRLVLGDPSDPGTDIGPLIEADAQRRLQAARAHAQSVATIAYGYPDTRLPAAGHFVGPTIVTGIASDDRLARTELFGPLVCVFRADTFDAALALANETDSALTGGVYSRDPSHLERAVRAFDVGNLYLNRPITGALVGRQPFGGHRLSGLGTKAGGPDYLLQLVIPKTICVNTTRHGIPLG